MMEEIDSVLAEQRNDNDVPRIHDWENLEPGRGQRRRLDNDDPPVGDSTRLGATVHAR